MGDIVLEKSGGGDNLPVGRTVLFDHEITAVPTNFAARVRPTSGVDSRYLTYLLRHLYESGATARAIKQTTGIQNLDTDAWLTTEAPLPSEDEQLRIADFLDDRVARIDRIIAGRREQTFSAREAYESARRAVVLGTNSTCTLVTDLPWALEVGGDRVVRRLAQVAAMGTGHTPSRSNPDYWIDCTTPWLTTSDVHRFRRDEIDEVATTAICISELGLANSAAVLHPAGTVALSRTASAGFSIVMGTDMATSQDFVTWTCGSDLDPHFLLASLRVMRPFLLGYLATGSTHKTIYFPDLTDLRIPIPPLAAQRQSVVDVRALDADYRSGNAALNRQVGLLTEYKASLITAAVTGELDVTTAGSNIPG
ncbi:restriction endonuclease subunit S [Janibacter indicus]|uniref:restriction endonuclease subunit S n=1 Tax=Janibacter indicus TaxID=857417 RepID=UPI0013DDE648|nr:restriction endonuclease subunit S [Janibacter indicus]